MERQKVFFSRRFSVFGEALSVKEFEKSVGIAVFLRLYNQTLIFAEIECEIFQ